MDLQHGSGSSGSSGSPGASKPPQTAEWAERRKQTHLRCEKQRREAINNGYVELKELLPESMLPVGCKQTNASILFRTCDYLKQMEESNRANEEKLKKKRARLEAMQMIASQYESMIGEASSSASSPLCVQCEMLRALLEYCFESFSSQIDVSDYESITRTLILWADRLDVQRLPTVMVEAAANANGGSHRR
uniref:BHLH domain-containing protein n=1 Tax=Steinernema glaseri TaxID=37863 RepID=A0A1I7ZFV8_9BILA